jgi:hypothetical protein
MTQIRSTQLETQERAAHFARIIANGGRRSDCVRFAADNWGVGERSCDKYLAMARDKLKADWDIERPQMVADLLSQCATLQQEAREKGQLHIALGAINTAAKLAQICS